MLAGKSLGSVSLISPQRLSTEWVGAMILDARSRAAYDEGHLPHSLHTEWEEWTEQKPNFFHWLFGTAAKWGLVPSDTAKVQDKLRKLGLKQNQPVVVVGSPNGWGEEGRIAWNLLYFGVDRVALLDGGFERWQREGLPIETQSNRPQRHGDFNVNLRPERRALLEEVQSLVTHKHPLLDARTPEEFQGKKVSGQKRGGHLPGARLVPLKSLYQTHGQYIDEHQLQSLVGELPPPVVTYCTGGVRSALLALLIEARLGQVAKNYDGSLWQWSSRSDLPLIPSNVTP